jgi:hypothetical protein
MYKSLKKSCLCSKKAHILSTFLLNTFYFLLVTTYFIIFIKVPTNQLESALMSISKVESALDENIFMS